jgi:hypothetical protein
MVSKKFVLATAALAAASFAGTSHAATVLTSGDTVDGWKITFPVGIALVSDGPDVTLEKFAAFDNIEGLPITFVQVSASASPTVVITDESLTNVTGETWTGFQFLLANELPGNTAPAAFTGPVFAGDTAPFASQTETADTITLSDGTLANTDTAKFGFDAAGGQLTIDTNPATDGSMKVFDLKEIPLVTAVPIPAAAWTGLSGLVGLGLIGSAKRLRRIA